jgi:hypothetical protein
VAGHPWRIGTRPGGANDALLLANLLLAGARSPEEITSLLDGIGRAVLEPGADPGPEGQRFLRALAGLAAPHRRALELEAELAARPAGTALDAGAAELTRALLDGDVADPADAARAATRARALGLDLDRPVRAVVIRPASGGLSGSVHEDLAAAGIRLVAGRAGEVGFLAGDDDALDSVLAGLGRPGRFIGVGRAHTGAAGAARSYAEARRAADFAAGLDRPVLRHEDLGLFSLLADDGDPDPLADLVAEWLGPLLAHDAGRRQTLLPTLAAYLDSGAAQQATADALGVHVSTLKYRLGRIGEVLGRDLSAPDVRFQLQVALAAHRTLSVLRSTASRPTGD